MIELPQILLAHAGENHWYDYVFFLVPVLIVGLTILIERRRSERDEKPDDDSKRPRRPKR